MIDDAIKNISKVLKKLKAIKKHDAYTMQEMQEIRTLLLKTVREDIDVYAFGHLPNKRHY